MCNEADKLDSEESNREHEKHRQTDGPTQKHRERERGKRRGREIDEEGEGERDGDRERGKEREIRIIYLYYLLFPFSRHFDLKDYNDFRINFSPFL